MPIAFSKLKKFSPKLVVLAATEDSPEKKFITDERFLIPAEAVSGIPMDIQINPLRSIGKLLPKYQFNSEGYLRFEYSNISHNMTDKSGNRYVSELFTQDIIRKEDDPPPLMMAIDQKYTQLFGIEAFYKEQYSGHIEFCFEGGNYWGILMPLSEWCGLSGYVFTDEHVVKYLFPNAVERIKKSNAVSPEDVMEYQRQIASLREQVDTLNIDKREAINHLESEIENLRKQNKQNVAEPVSKSWPQPLLESPITGKTMEDCKCDEFQIDSVNVLLPYLRKHMPLEREVFLAVYVNQSNAVLNTEYISIGTEEQTAVYPREVAKKCLKNNATGVIVAHNHPSGHLKPSQADQDITRALDAAVKALDIRLLDHVIVGAEGAGYFSFRENGLIR